MVGDFTIIQVVLAEGLLGEGTIWGRDKPCTAMVPAQPGLVQGW